MGLLDSLQYLSDKNEIRESETYQTLYKNISYKLTQKAEYGFTDSYVTIEELWKGDFWEDCLREVIEELKEDGLRVCIKGEDELWIAWDRRYYYD